MAAKKKAAAAGATALSLKDSGAVQRVLQDEDVRQNFVTAYVALRDAYGRINNGKSPQKVVFDDKKFQKNLKVAAENLRDAGEALREGPKKKKKRRFSRVLLVAVVGGVAAIALSEDLRKKVLDLLFGAEEEFDYSSTTTPAAPAPAASTPA